mgnify:CR=1 FL=1
MSVTATITALDLVRERRAANLQKWGIQHYPDGTRNTAYARARRRAAQNAEDAAARNHKLTWATIFNEEAAEALCEVDADKLLAELGDIGAVVLDWMDDILQRSRRRTAHRRKSVLAGKGGK